MFQNWINFLALELTVVIVLVWLFTLGWDSNRKFEMTTRMLFALFATWSLWAGLSFGYDYFLTS